MSSVEGMPGTGQSTTLEGTVLYCTFCEVVMGPMSGCQVALSGRGDEC